MLPLSVGSGNQPDQIAVALLVHGQQAKWPELIRVIGIEDFQVYPEDGLDAATEGRLIHLDEAIEITDVGNGNSGHAHSGNTLYQRLDPDQAINQGIFCMEAEMNKFCHPRDSTLLDLIVVLAKVKKMNKGELGTGV